MTPADCRSAREGSVSFSLGDSDLGTRLDRFLCDSLGISRARARDLLARGAVSLDGRVRGFGDKGLSLPARGCVEVRPAEHWSEQRARPSPGARPDAPSEPDDASLPAAAVSVLARGPGWLAVDKPAGWPVHPLREHETATVLNAVAVEHPEIHGVGEEGGLRSGVVHRLDVGTSGVLLFATEDAQWTRLRTAFREHRVEKLYRAIVVGALEARDDGGWGEPMELELAVARHRPARVRVVEGLFREGRSGYRVRQRLRVVERLHGATLIEVEIETGFLHQVRVTLAHLGHPIVGDALYGDDAALALGAERQLLHAARLRYEEVFAESPDPEDFRELLERVRGAASGREPPRESTGGG